MLTPSTTSTSFARLVGVVFGAIGLGLGSLAGFIVWRQLGSKGSIDAVAAVLVVVLLTIAWFCSSAGWRLALNRPNRYGSIIRPWAWRALAAIFLLIALSLVLFAAMEATFLRAWPALACVGFALLCFWRARMLGRLLNPVLPPNTLVERALTKVEKFFQPEPGVVLPDGSSLLEMPDFLTSDFRQGVEILNDNVTPMEFVVSTLCTHAGLREPDAVKTMLDIHKRGGALLPMESMERATTVAQAISADAANHGHPFVCRAVNVARSRHESVLARPA